MSIFDVRRSLSNESYASRHSRYFGYLYVTVDSNNMSYNNLGVFLIISYVNPIVSYATKLIGFINSYDLVAT